MDQTTKAGLLSVVLPSYNEEASIPRAADTVSARYPPCQVRSRP